MDIALQAKQVVDRISTLHIQFPESTSGPEKMLAWALVKLKRACFWKVLRKLVFLFLLQEPETGNGPFGLYSKHGFWEQQRVRTYSMYVFPKVIQKIPE